MRRILKKICVLFFLFIFLVSCGTTKESNLNKIVVCTTGTLEPYSLIKSDGTWTGIDAEMWKEIEKRTGWKVEVKQASFDSLWGELDTCRADIVANCMGEKPERLEKYISSRPYYADEQVIVIRDQEKNQIKTFSDLKGKIIGCTNGAAVQTLVEELAQKEKFEVKLYEQSNLGLNDLNLGRIQGYADALTDVNSYMHNNKSVKFHYLDQELSKTNVVYYIQKTDRGEKIKKELNIVLQEMIKDGTVKKITEKWLYEDMTKKIK